MNILRTMLIGLASFVCIAAISLFVYALTLQTTIMDRTTVKNWLSDSKIYDGKIISALVQTTNAGGGQDGAPQPEAGKISASPEAIKTALNTAFTPDFVQTQIEGVVDDAYNWIDGTAPEFKFSIPIDQKRDTLITQLAKGIEPQIAALPICRSVQITQEPTCRPAGLSVEQFANQLTAQSIDESGAFAAPITNASFSKKSQQGTSQPDSTVLTQLPAIRKGIDMLLIVLPIAAIISIVIIVSVTTHGRRIATAAHLARRIFLGMLFILIPAVAVVWIARGNDFGLASMFNAQTGALVVPLIKTIAVGILSQLAIISGIVGGISAVIWICLSIWQRKTPQPIPVTPTPTPISTPTPSYTPTPPSSEII